MPPDSLSIAAGPLVSAGEAWAEAAYREMLRIRMFEEAVLGCQREGLVAGAVHPYTGQEAVAVGVLAARDPAEWVVSFYRCHGHAIAAGSPLPGLMRELLGRAGGVCGGKAGSMHLADRSRRFLGASSIVAGQLPVAAGVAMAEKAERTGRAVVVFCGDGALGAGVSHEALTAAEVLGLPLLVVCEDNGWQDQTRSALVRRLSPARLVAGLGLPCAEVDGNDVDAVRDTATDLLDRCRTRCAPQVLVAATYLRDFHSQTGRDRPEEYRPEAERTRWAARDPIARAASRLPGAAGIGESVATEIAAVVADARSAPPADPASAASGVTVHGWGR